MVRQQAQVSFAATAALSAASARSTTANSSPPSRAAKSDFRSCAVSLAETSMSNLSPTA
jgi:hypothetical protein